MTVRILQSSAYDTKIPETKNRISHLVIAKTLKYFF